MKVLLVVLLVLSLLGSVGLAIIWFQTNQARRAAEARAAHEAWQEGNLSERVQQLSKYQAIIDVDAYVARASSTAARNTADADAQIAAAKQRANDESSRIIAEANTRAREIAGEALAAVQKAKELEQTVRAMQNVIEGYGDRYVLPSTRKEVERLGIQCAWTMAAACREFRETQALELSMAVDPERARTWTSQNIREHATPALESRLMDAEA